MDIQLSKNFSLSEFCRSDTARKYHIENIPSDEQIAWIRELCTDVLQPIRDKVGKPISIGSGYRCKELNRKVGGVFNSQHQCLDRCAAADINLGNKIQNRALFNLIKEMVRTKQITLDQCIDEKNFAWVHVSFVTGGKVNRNQFLSIS